MDRQVTLDRPLREWLDRLSDLRDDYELFPDMRPIGEIIEPIVADYLGLTAWELRASRQRRTG